MKDKQRLSGKPFEDLIYKIYKELEPYASIKKNDRIKGWESGIDREIDISIRKDFGGHEILMIIQAKDHKTKADVKILGEFDSVIRDVRASRGILICNAGFTKTANEYAKNRAIDLCTAHDASNKDWQGEIKIPIVRKSTTVNYSLRLPFSITKEMKENYPEAKIQFKTGPHGLVLKNNKGQEIQFLDVFLELWNSNKISKEEGNHDVKLDAYMDLFVDIVSPLVSLRQSTGPNELKSHLCLQIGKEVIDATTIYPTGRPHQRGYVWADSQT
jgi:hypothetical protein